MAHKFYNDRLIPGIEFYSGSIGTFKVSPSFTTTSSVDV